MTGGAWCSGLNGHEVAAPSANRRRILRLFACLQEATMHCTRSSKAI